MSCTGNWTRIQSPTYYPGPTLMNFVDQSQRAIHYSRPPPGTWIYATSSFFIIFLYSFPMCSFVQILCKEWGQLCHANGECWVWVHVRVPGQCTEAGTHTTDGQVLSHAYSRSVSVITCVIITWCLATFKRLVKTELYNGAYLRWFVTTRTYDSSICEWL